MKVVVVVGGETAGALGGYKLEDWAYLKSGLLLNSKEMGVVFDEHPEDAFTLIRRNA